MAPVSGACVMDLPDFWIVWSVDCIIGLLVVATTDCWCVDLERLIGFCRISMLYGQLAVVCLAYLLINIKPSCHN